MKCYELRVSDLIVVNVVVRGKKETGKTTFCHKVRSEGSQSVYEPESPHRVTTCTFLSPAGTKRLFCVIFIALIVRMISFPFLFFKHPMAGDEIDVEACRLVRI